MLVNEKANVPEKVWLPKDRRLDELEELNLDRLHGEGRAFLTYETAIMEGRLVHIIGIQKWILDENQQVQSVHCWLFCKGHPKRFGYNGLHYIDDEIARKRNFQKPYASKMHIVTEVDPSLVEKGADKRELRAVVDWALAMVNIN